MGHIAEYRDDICGLLTTSGTSTAYVVTTNQGLCLSPSTTPQDGQQLSITVNATNGLSPTLQADTCNTYPIQSSAGVAVPAATLVSGSPYTLKFSNANLAWMLRDFYSSATYQIPLGGFIYSSISTPPNSNFIAPAGRCISTTTYASYWTALGSPGTGGCSGGQFPVADVRGRNLTALDNLGGSAASRLASSSSGCGTAFTSMGATCVNGGENRTLTLAQLPTGITSSGTVTVTSTLSNVVSGPANSGYAPGSNNALTFYSSSAITSTGSNSMTSNNTGGGAHSVVNPNIGVYIYLRVI